MKTMTRSLPAALLALAACCPMMFACSHPSGGESAPDDAAVQVHRLGAQIPAAQAGQGPIPEFTDTASLGAFSTTNMNAGFFAFVGGTEYVYTPNAYLATDAGIAVAGNNGGEWLPLMGASATDAGVLSLSVGGPLQGVGSPLEYASTSIALSSGTVTLTAAQYINPVIVLTGSESSTETIVFPNVVAQWWVDITGATLTTNAVTLECGSGAKTTSLTSSSTVGLYKVYCNGGNKFYQALEAQ